MFRRSLMFSFCLALTAAPAVARETTIRFVPEVPTVLGIRPDPPVIGYGRQRYVNRRPRAALDRLDAPAPANGCEAAQGGFRVVSGLDDERGCFGRR